MFVKIPFRMQSANKKFCLPNSIDFNKSTLEIENVLKSTKLLSPIITVDKEEQLLMENRPLPILSSHFDHWLAILKQ